MERVRYGFWRVYTLLRREGWMVNHKRVYRLYKEEGLNLRSKRPRRSRAAAHRLPRLDVGRSHESWSMDFVADALFDGRRFRALTVVDYFSRRCLAIRADQSIKGADVTAVVAQISARAGRTPDRIQVDNGSEFISKALDRWAYENEVTLDFSRPGKPTDNPYIESFNGSFRDECLNLHWFLSLDDARTKIEAWRRDYNGFRPYSSLDGLTPDEYTDKYQNARFSSSDRVKKGEGLSLNTIFLYLSTGRLTGKLTWAPRRRALANSRTLKMCLVFRAGTGRVRTYY